MTKDDNYTDEIAAHEAGHCLALAASGLADEFQKSTIRPQDGVRGLTTRSGHSLVNLSMDLAQHAQRLATQEEPVNEFKAFLKEKAPRTCLPHLCFFFGGGALDRFLGREHPPRNAIDMRAIQGMVIPAMAIQVTDQELAEVQEKVDEFLWNAFKTDGTLLKSLYNALVERQTITANDDLLREMRAAPVSDTYRTLLAWFTEWYKPRVDAIL